MFEQTPTEDIFAKTDAAAPHIISPTAPTPPSEQTPESLTPTLPTAAPSGSRVKIVVILLAILVVIVAAFFISFHILTSRTPVTPKPPDATSAQPKTAVPETSPSPASSPSASAVTPSPALVATEKDSDKDGLTDTQENQLGTNPQSVDSDSDGLFDREEVEVYGTNPLNPDTDGDTYTDSAEVKAGYNPKGSGKLLQLPSESK